MKAGINGHAPGITQAKRATLAKDEHTPYGTSGNPLPNSHPQTLALAYLDARQYAKVQWRGDSRGYCQPHLVEVVKLRHWRQDFFIYRGSIYARMEIEDVRSDLTMYLNQSHAFDGNAHVKMVRVTANLMRDVLMQLTAICHVRVKSMPAWIGGETDRPDPADIITFSNGLLDWRAWLADPDAINATRPSDEWFHACTPNWFSASGIMRPFTIGGKCPTAMSFFRSSLITDDQILLNQEILGYLISGDNTFEKMVWGHGLSGGGKGTWAKILCEAVGESVVSFALPDLARPFTLNSWKDKLLAIARDAHLGDRDPDAYKILNALLGIAGRDPQYVDRKNKDAHEDLLIPSRIVVALEAFPRLPGVDTGIRRRSLILSFDRSFKDNPDNNLFQKIKREMGAVIYWGLLGLRRLHEQGRFTETARSRELLDRLCNTSSPVKMFVGETIELIPLEIAANGNVKPRPRELKRHVFLIWEKWRVEYGEKAIGFNNLCERI